MPRTLDAEVVQALAQAGHRARAFQDVTTIRFPSFRRATYRIDLDSGETIKARCLEDEASAQQLFEIRRSLPSAFVPAFFHHGRVLLERWVPGTILGTTPPEHAHLIETGALLATLHAARDVGDQDDGTGPWRTRTERGLRTLVESGALQTCDAERLKCHMTDADPGRAVAGLGHFDFCGENMVVDHSGRMHVFDNERVGPGALGFDLARAWYRWRLPEHSWAVFSEAYADVRGRDDVAADPAFWRVVVLVHSACLRLRSDPTHLSAPVTMLRRLADPATEGSTP